MNSASVDAARRTVRVAGGGTWGDVDRETQKFGLATPGGIVTRRSTTFHYCWATAGGFLELLGE